MKHSKFEGHKFSISQLNKPQTLNDYFKVTPIGKTMDTDSDEAKSRVNKLIDICYCLSKESALFEIS